MSVIKINAITVPSTTGTELADRFIARQAEGTMTNVEGFQGFELFQPTDEREQWLVVTRWDTDEAFKNWMGSNDFIRAHQRTTDETGRKTKPIGTHAELWSYEIAVSG